jgi:hypothetical protein
MKRPVVNALLDLVAALLVLGMVATGLVLQLVLPPGSGRTWILWSLERHDWAAVHAYTSTALIGVLVVHVALHWRWVVEMMGKRLSTRRVSPGAFGAAVVAGIVLCFAALGGAAYRAREPRRSLAECDAPSAAPESIAPSVSYTRDVSPLLALRCVGCHSVARPKGGVRLDDYEAARSYALPGQAAEGRLLTVLRGHRDSAHTLDATSLDLLERWVCGGATR